MDTIRGKFLKQHLLSDEFLDLIEKNKRPMDAVSYTHLTLPTIA